MRVADRRADILVAGYRNVTTACGVEGFTPELLAAFQAHKTERVLIAFDRAGFGRRGAAKVAEQLMASGECFRIEFPQVQAPSSLSELPVARAEVCGV